MLLKTLRLKNKADRRLKFGHLWIYSNEVDVKATPLRTFDPGEMALVETLLENPWEQPISTRIH